MPRAQHRQIDFPSLASQIRQDGNEGHQAAEGTGKENTELKKIVADQMLNIRVLEAVNAKFTRESIILTVARSLKAEDVLAALERLPSLNVRCRVT